MDAWIDSFLNNDSKIFNYINEYDIVSCAARHVGQTTLLDSISMTVVGNHLIDTMHHYLNEKRAKYKYPHEYGGYVDQQYLPNEIKDHVYYIPSQNGSEKNIVLPDNKTNKKVQNVKIKHQK